MEIGQRRKPTACRDFSDRAVGANQLQAGLRDTQVVHIVGERFAHGLLEGSAEGGGADMQEWCGLGHGQLCIHVLMCPSQKPLDPMTAVGCGWAC